MARHVTQSLLAPNNPMIVNLRIVGVRTGGTCCSFYSDVEICGEKKDISGGEIHFRIGNIHDRYFGEAKIMLYRDPQRTKCIFFACLPLRRLPEGGSRTLNLPIFDRCASDDYESYRFGFQKKRGRVRVVCTCSERAFMETVDHKPGFIDRIFSLFLSGKSDTRISELVRKALEITKGSVSSKMNTFRGWLSVQGYYESKSKSQCKTEDISGFLAALKRSICTRKLDGYVSFASSGETLVREGGLDSILQGVAPEGTASTENALFFGIGFYRYFQNMLYYSLAPYGTGIPNFRIPTRLRVRRRGMDKTTRVLLGFLGIPETDLILVNLDQKDNALAFIVFLHADSVIVSFRGTLSTQDVSSILKFEYSEFYKGYAHGGIKNLGCLFVREYWTAIEETLAKHKRERLVLTGHSLGGSIAMFVGYIVLEEKMFFPEKMRVVAYSPAPVFSKNLVDGGFSNFVSIYYGSDFVPFLSYGAVRELKYLWCSVGSYVSKHERASQDIGGLVKKLERFCARHNMYPKLYLAGRVVHLKTVIRRKGSLWQGVLRFLGWKAAKMPAESIALGSVQTHQSIDEVVFSQRGVVEHHPWFLLDAFEQNARAVEHLNFPVGA